MRLLYLTSLYSAYIQQFYAARPGLAQQPYQMQKAALDEDAFGWGDFWGHALAPLGYQVTEVLANVKPLQRAWAQERGVPWRAESWLLDLPRAQVERFRPDILFLDDFSTFSAAWLSELRQAAPGLRLILGWCGAPYQDASVFQGYDAVLSCIPEMAAQFKAMGHRSHHLHHAFEPRILARLGEAGEPDIPVSFVGSLNRGREAHRDREELLLALSRQTPVQIFTPNLDLGLGAQLGTLGRGLLYRGMAAAKGAGAPAAWLARLPLVGRAATWTFRPLAAVHPGLKPLARPGVFGLEMYRLLRRSQVTLNHHIALSAHSASNMRLFEATGVGACLLTDWKDNLAELFEPEQEVATYRSHAECVEKVQWLLRNPQARQAMAKAGQTRTLRCHTFAHRAPRLDEIIRQELRRQAA
jgi:hypothetical protein